MSWTQIVDPLNNLVLSALLAVLPVAFIFWALIVRRMKGYLASLLAAVVAMAVAIVFYRMPASLALLSAAHGALYGLFPICWIVLSAVFLFNLTIKSGQFEVIRAFMISITSDRRLQALLIAFSFGAFLEGTSGFGTPVAITAAMLVGLGFNPLYAAGVCLVANTAPVAFGSIGIPIIVAGQVTGIPDFAISQMVGRTLPFLSVLLPFYLVVLIAGFKKTKEVWPAVLVSGVSFAFFQWFSANYLGPMLPDIIAGLCSIICLLILLRFWKPKTVWRFENEPAPTIEATVTYPPSAVLKAWSPYIVLTTMIICWGAQPVQAAFNSIASPKFEIPFLHNAIKNVDGTPLAQIFKFNYLAAAGTAIFISALISIPLIGLRYRESFQIFKQTLKQLRYPFISISSILAFAYIVNNSGISITLAAAFAGTGILFPLFSPVLGWLGVFITGSDTSSNALFGKLQTTTATEIGMDPLIAIGANTSGGVVAKMISPQSIAVAAAAGNLVGKESQLFRFAVKHSFIMLGIICLITVVQTYFSNLIIPEYNMPAANATSAGVQSPANLSYLAIPALIVIVPILVAIALNRTQMLKKI